MTTHETATRYPLSWPTTWKRTTYGQRKVANFSRRVTKNYTGAMQGSYTQKERLTVSQALDRLQNELRVSTRTRRTRRMQDDDVFTRVDGQCAVGQHPTAKEPQHAAVGRQRRKDG